MLFREHVHSTLFNYYNQHTQEQGEVPGSHVAKFGRPHVNIHQFNLPTYGTNSIMYERFVQKFPCNTWHELVSK
jgi:hypothetical protein